MKKTDRLKNIFFKSIKIFHHVPKTGKPSSIPGTISYFGERGNKDIRLDLFNYNRDQFLEKENISIDEVVQYFDSGNINWLNVSGVHDAKLIEQIGAHFDIHPLVLEDIANTTNRPKFEDYDDYLYIVLKMIYFDPDLNEVIIEQVSAILKEECVIVFQENGLDVFDGLRERIRNDTGRIRKMGSDYLLYCIIDAVIDHYFIVLEKVGEETEDIEDILIANTDKHILTRIYRLKQELVFLRKSIWPTRELVSKMQRSGHALISEPTWFFYRDLYDHTVQVLETVETFRDMVSSMLDLYLSISSNKMNETMKVLTVFAAVFIPLTFIAGVYGMNFEYIPELKWKNGYFIWWGIIVFIAICMLVLFKRKKWL